MDSFAGNASKATAATAAATARTETTIPECIILFAVSDYCELDTRSEIVCRAVYMSAGRAVWWCAVLLHITHRVPYVQYSLNIFR